MELAMTLASRLTFGLLLASMTAIGCSGGGTTANPGTAGTSGGGTSGGGTGGGTGGGGGSSAGFMSFAPCAAATDYVAGTTINFGGAVGFNYDPKCLKVSAGATVTFSGDFLTHPLAPSAMRGDPANNPIVNMSDGTTASFVFPMPGFYAYLCNFHGTDDGLFMSGVIWVQ
jgi:plastocyanin